MLLDSENCASLSGRSADLITTMDTPPLIYRFVYRAPGREALGQRVATATCTSSISAMTMTIREPHAAAGCL